MPRGTSAVDYRAHNPTDGGSIPSPATKHQKIFMYAIDTKLMPFKYQKKTAKKNWQNIFLADSPLPELLTFCQECVDQNLVLNLVTRLKYDKGQLIILSENLTWVTMDGIIKIDEDFSNNEPWQYIVRYYAVDLSKAKLFVQKIEDMSANFSLKKFWHQNKFDFSVEYSTVDFATEITSFEWVNIPCAEIWGISWPSAQIAYDMKYCWTNNLWSPSTVG